MSKSESFSFEPGSEEMFADYATLYNEVNSFDSPDHIELKKEFFQSSFSYPTIDISRDIVLVRNTEGNLVASGTIFTQNQSSPISKIGIQVHPDFRGQGIGSRVMQQLVQIGRNRGSSQIICRFPSFRDYVIPFLESHNFKHDYTWIKMSIKHKDPISIPPLPWGLTIRALNVKQELLLWANLQNTIFQDRVDYESVDMESLRSLTKLVNFDHNLLTIAKLHDIPIGYCFALPVESVYAERTVQIQGIGILPHYRGRGYGRTLLIETLNRAYLKGYTTTELVVISNNEAAFRLYEECGFREKYRYLWYKLSLEN
ncbi:MAG: GNAT family N-acetyltransferase [Candidatus Thorarchaeota archaeon]